MSFVINLNYLPMRRQQCYVLLSIFFSLVFHCLLLHIYFFIIVMCALDVLLIKALFNQSINQSFYCKKGMTKSTPTREQTVMK